jgi:hypothetical protein
MTPTAEQDGNEMRGGRHRLTGRGARGWSSPRLRWASTLSAALVGLMLIAAGCGGSKSPNVAGGGGDTAGGSSSAVLAQFEAYARCMRTHGIHDFPDPTTSPGGGVAFQINGGPGSDLDRNNPRFQAANEACHSLEPGGGQPPAQSAEKIAAEVKWAQCMRTHGLPSFPDPDSQGAFDSSKFNESASAFQSASDACQSLMKKVGAIPVHPGRPG